jgi:hypothetical protein
MKTHFPNTRWFRSWASIVILPGLLSSGSVFAAISAVTASEAPPQTQVEARIQFSAGIPEILRMIDAKVEGSVILAYIDSSPTAYNPSASEIIMLRDQGVSSEILAALLKHGSEVRARAIASAPPAQPTPPTATPYPQSPDYSYAPPMSYSDYGYPSYSYYGYPSYSYSYPSYGYGYWPAFYFGYYPYHSYYYHRYPYFNRYSYHSFGRFNYGNHFTAFRNQSRFNGGGFRAVASPRSPVTIGGHGGFRGGSFNGGFRGGVVRGGGGFTAHAGGGGHMGGRMR